MLATLIPFSLLLKLSIVLAVCLLLVKVLPFGLHMRASTSLRVGEFLNFVFQNVNGVLLSKSKLRTQDPLRHSKVFHFYETLVCCAPSTTSTPSNQTLSVVVTTSNAILHHTIVFVVTLLFRSGVFRNKMVLRCRSKSYPEMRIIP